MNKNFKRFNKLVSFLAGVAITTSGCAVDTNEKNDSDDFVVVQHVNMEQIVGKKAVMKFETVTRPVSPEPISTVATDSFQTTTANNTTTTSSLTTESILNDNNTVTAVFTPSIGLDDISTDVVSTDIPNIVTTDISTSVSYDTIGSELHESYETYSEPTIKYNYDSTGRFAYVDNNETYVVQDGEKISDICNKFSMEYDLFHALNPGVDSLSAGDSINYISKFEYYIPNGNESLSTVFFNTGVTEDKIRKLNNIPSDVDTVDGMVLLHKFYGNESCYETVFGISNVIRNNRIYGDKIITATGFNGASNYCLVLEKSRFISGINCVIKYSFDGSNSYTSCVMCKNARDISSVDGMPIIYTRNTFDIVALMLENNVSASDPILNSWVSETSYTTFVNEEGYNYIPMNASENVKVK